MKMRRDQRHLAFPFSGPNFFQQIVVKSFLPLEIKLFVLLNSLVMFLPFPIKAQTARVNCHILAVHILLVIRN